MGVVGTPVPMMMQAMAASGIGEAHLDLGHVAIFRTLVRRAGIAAALQALDKSDKKVVTITHDHKLVALADNLLRMQAGRVLPSVQGGSV